MKTSGSPFSFALFAFFRGYSVFAFSFAALRKVFFLQPTGPNCVLRKASKKGTMGVQ
jgi:hypothetical protein